MTRLETSHTVERILDEVRERGFCVVPELLTPREVATLRGTLTAIRELEITSQQQIAGRQRVLHLVAKHACFMRTLTHPLSLTVWRRFLGEDMMCSSLTGHTLMPGAQQIYWHADHPYWTIAPPYPVDLPLAAQTIFFLDDFTEENGATGFIAGSHREPRLPELGTAWPDGAVVATGPAGSAAFVHGALWHTMRPNCSSAPRSAVLTRFIRSFCVPQEDMRFQLELLENPSEDVVLLLGGKQYRPTRGFPY
jgi:ectoine hydroxylase-related dioxygenase (phytanoyl-CoA dioxygenase family)